MGINIVIMSSIYMSTITPIEYSQATSIVQLALLTIYNCLPVPGYCIYLKCQKLNM